MSREPYPYAQQNSGTFRVGQLRHTGRMRRVEDVGGMDWELSARGVGMRVSLSELVVMLSGGMAQGQTVARARLMGANTVADSRVEGGVWATPGEKTCYAT